MIDIILTEVSRATMSTRPVELPCVFIWWAKNAKPCRVNVLVLLFTLQTDSEIPTVLFFFFNPNTCIFARLQIANTY